MNQTIHNHFIPKTLKQIVKKQTVFKAVFPYLLVAILLLITRMPELKIGQMLKNSSLSITFLNINHIATPFYSPGFLFFLTAITASIVYKMQIKQLVISTKESLHKLKSPLLTLIFTIATVQIIINTAINNLGIQGMPAIIGSVFAKFGVFHTLFAPLLGAMGALISGSNTVSNLLFGPLQLETAIALNLAPAIILALQSVGGAVGNMLAVNNIIAASATVGLNGEEGHIMRINILPTLIYALLAGIIAMLIFN